MQLRRIQSLAVEYFLHFSIKYYDDALYSSGWHNN